MTNASKFLKEFGWYATEVWAMPEKNFLAWLNAEAIETEPTLYEYKLDHLAFVAALLQNKGVTEENLADVINCVDWVVGLVLDNMKERVIQSVMGQSKKVEPYAYSPSNCGAKMQSTMSQLKPQEPVNDGGDNR